VQVAIATLFQWASIYIAHLRFRTGLRAQGKKLSTLPFKGMLTPYAQYFSLVIVLFIFGCEFYLACFPFGEKGSAKSFFSTYLAAPLFVFDYFVYKVCLPSLLLVLLRCSAVRRKRELLMEATAVVVQDEDCQAE
jgi:amino acid permease